MAKLTDKKLAALEAIAAAPGKSGAYWRDLGHSPITLSVLERDRLAEGKGGYFSTTGTRRQWFILPAGRLALSEQKEERG